MMQSKRLASFARGASGSAAAPIARSVAQRGAAPARKATVAGKSITKITVASKIQTSVPTARSYSTSNFALDYPLLRFLCFAPHTIYWHPSSTIIIPTLAELGVSKRERQM